MASKRTVKRWESWGEYVDQCEKPGHERYTTSASRGYGEWHGANDYPTAIRQAREGWTEGEAAVKRISETLVSAVLPGITKEEWNYEVEGVTFDTARYLEGEPEHWVKIEEIEQENASKHVRVVYNSAASGGVNARALYNRGAAVAALVECLEYAGHRVELWATMGLSHTYRGRENSTGLETWVKVKAYDQPLDMGRVAFALASPSMFRRLGFRIIEQDTAYIEKAGHGYGYPCEVEASEEDTLYIGEMMYGEGDWNREEYITRWVLENLKRQGVDIEMAAVKGVSK